VAWAWTASGANPEERPTKNWFRQGPLGETPKHATDAFPLSDQQNKAGWTRFEPMSDEFDGKELDRSKWTVGMAWWKGRQPALFSEKNVTVSDGKLHLTMRKEKLQPEVEKLGYHDYTSAALHSKVRSGYGYYEVKAKPMNSGGSSSFWFHKGDTPGWQTEIDVFEIGGKAKGFEQKLNITVHVWQTPQEKKHWQVGGAWLAPWRLADDYHVYGFDWGKDELKFYVDGVVVRTVENTHWHQPLLLTFDSETMPEWMGMPKDEDLPSTFSVEYVRAWKRAEDTKPTRTKTAFKGWELYVWQEKGDTFFSLMEGTNRLKTDKEIAAAAVKGIEAVKPKLDELKPGEEVFLQGRKLMAEPPKAQADSLREYCHKIELQCQ
jgi:beta-glucanase (GH16 family)